MTQGSDTPGNGKPPAKRPGQEAPRPLPKRFYTSVSVVPHAEGFAVRLDGRPIRTPARRELVLGTEALARAVADEWEAQGEHIDPATMPLTRIANTAIDAEERMGEVAADIVAFAGSDLLCYRAEAPEGLVARQSAHWDPVLAWAKRALGAAFVLREGVMPIAQPDAALGAVARALEAFDPIPLAALHVMTTVSGSALLALAVAEGALSLEDAWSAATVDETWQREQWGIDAEAEAASRHKHEEFMAASRLIALSRQS